MAEESEMHRIGILLVEALKDKLTKEHGKFTGSLQSSITYKLDGDDVVISMEDYAEYLEYGTPNPTTPDEILNWVEVKIMPNIKVSGKNRSEQKMNIAKSLAKHITKYGPRPFSFIRTTIREDLPKILG